MSFNQKRKGFAKDPSKFPAVFSWNDGTSQFDVLAADEPAFVGLKMNCRSIDGPALKAIPEGRTTGVTVDQLKGVLVEGGGAEWREPRPALVNEPDGAPMVCAICVETKQPVKYSVTDRETGETEERGNFMELKAERLETLKESNPELLASAEAHTREIIGPDPDAVMPKFVRTLFVCEDDKAAERRGKDPVFRTYYSRATILERLFERNTRIQAAVRRNVLNDILGSKRNDPRAVRQMHERYGVSERGSRFDRRPRKAMATFTGVDGSAEFEASTVKALTRAGVASLGEIKAASNQRLAELGAISSADHQPAADSVRHRAQVGLERAAKSVVAAAVPDLEEVEAAAPRRSADRPSNKRTGRYGARFGKTATK